MPAVKHVAYKEELERCNYTLGYVERVLNETISKKEKMDKNVESTKKHYNSESSQDYIDLIINTSIQDNLVLKLRNLVTAKSKPYFARIDFNDGNIIKNEKIYIGKMSLMREEDQEVIIVDWRAPIANLYYEGRIGEAGYLCPEGTITGDLSLKRQFSINSGELQEIFDIDITTNDEFLQSYLGANADSRLKEIVSTIQEEQNKIVRYDMWTPLIVQGVAGSGKTTIALHRIAYLIYTYEKSFQPENFMIIAPNKLFLNYISEVLPELGVEKVKQTTFEDFCMEILGKKFKIRDANEKLTAFINHNSTEDQRIDNNFIKSSTEFKASFLFKEAIDRYIVEVEESFIPKENFIFAGRVVYKYEDINKLFLVEYRNWPLFLRLNEIKKHLTNRMKLQKDSLINALHDQCDAKIYNLKQTLVECDERQELIIEAIDKKNEIINKLESFSKKAVKEYIDKISRLDPFKYYKDFISDEKVFTKVLTGHVDQELSDFIRKYTEKVLNSGFIDIEDVAPIIYLKYRIYGMDEKIPVKHIVLDEAQDFSVFQLYVMRKIIKDSSFTILGDLSQGIHSYRGIKSWEDVRKHVFDDRKSELLELEQSYRTTVEIMEAANSVIEKVRDMKPVKAKPVIRHGDKVEIIEKEGMKEVAEDIDKKIKELKNQGFKSIAVICKTLDECKKVLALMKKSSTLPAIITGKEDEYKSGIVILPSYLAKGLEFDAVMIANASSEEYKNENLDIKLLYVSMTRPLHKLFIYYHGEISPLLL
jgi:DNA helicase II / ATP-dependent DNA helicase PcrA